MNSRIATVAGLALAASISFQAPHAEAVELKMANFAPAKHPLWTNVMEPWGKALEKANPGITVRGFPGGSIGGAPPGAFLRAVNGVSDIELHLPGYTSTAFPRTLVMEIPLQHETPSEATRAFWRIFQKHMTPEYNRVKLLASFGNDLPAVMTNKVVRVPDDLKGFKLRTPSDNQAMIIEGLGAVPVAMPMTETYNSIQKGVVDGAIVGMSVVISFKIAEVVNNYITDVPFGYSPVIIAMNKKAYDGLPKSARDWIDKNSGVELSLKGAQNYERERDEAIEVVKKGKTTKVTSLTAAEKKQWEASLKKVVDNWVGRFEKQGIPYRQILNDYLAAKDK